jgi:hypothetical protein
MQGAISHLHYLIRFDGWIPELLPPVSQCKAEVPTFSFVIQTNGKRLVALVSFVASESETADPSASVGMTKGRLALWVCVREYGWKEIRNFSVEPIEEGRMENGYLHSQVPLLPGVEPQSPRSGRDDKGKVGSFGFAFAIWMGRGPETYPSGVTRKGKWEMAIGIPET